MGRNSRRKQTFVQDRLPNQQVQPVGHQLPNGATVVAIHENLTLGNHQIENDREISDEEFKNRIKSSSGQNQATLVDQTGQGSVVVQGGLHLETDIDSVQFSTNVEEQETPDPELIMFKVQFSVTLNF